jgi:solute carrier family 25 folate transporter 32
MIKTRMQVIESQSKDYRTLRSALRSVIRHEGFLGLYQGLFPAVIASSGSWGGYFFLYEFFKGRNKLAEGHDRENKVSMMSHHVRTAIFLYK